MNKLLLLVSIICVFQLSQAQDEIGKPYQTTVPLNLQECDLEGINQGNIKAIPEKAKFTVVNIVKENGSDDFEYIIRFWDWNDETKIQKTTKDEMVDGKKKTTTTKIEVNNNESKYFNLNYQPSNNTHRYFKLSASQLKYVCKPIIARIQPTAGTLILPIKFRFNPGDFSKDLTFSGTGGLRFNIKQNTDVSFSVIAGVGISSVTIDSTSTAGEISESTDLAAATVLGGVLLDWKILQIGVFSGFDWLARKNINNWCYQGKPWLGVGVGISLFTKDKASIKETGNKE